jgi:hypothetical protein
MSKRLIAGMLLLSSTCIASTQPHLFIGGMLGSSLTTILPANNTDTPTVLATILGAAAGDEAPILLEKSNTNNQHFVFSPTVGMTFPIANLFIIEGAVSLDLRKNEYTVTNEKKTDEILASIDRQIGITGALQMRVSKQYAIGPMFSATILRNTSAMYGASAKQEEHNIFGFGFQSSYEVNDSFSIAITCSTTLNQQIKLESPTNNDHNINLDYTDAKLLISARFNPI